MAQCAPVLAEPVLELKECAALEDPTDRLACYDALAAGIELRELEEMQHAREQQEVQDPQVSLPALAAGEEVVELPSAIELRMRQSRLVRQNFFAMTPYRPNYFLPVTYNSRPNQEMFQRSRGEDAQIDRVEAKFQFSLEFDVWREMLGQEMDLYFGYTQQAWWSTMSRRWVSSCVPTFRSWA
jgi:phospholipase A1